MIPNMLSIANGKGGVYKTSIATNLGGLAAASGWRVLIIDTDSQGHAALDLGVVDGSDFGAGLHGAMINGDDLYIMEEVRPGLDLVPGGEAAAPIVSGLAQMMSSGDFDLAFGSLERAVAPVADRYNLIVVDTPPGEKLLQQAVMTASHFVVIPTQVDKGSRSGIDRVCRDILKVERLNPDLRILGVVAVGLDRGSSAMKRDARAQLEVAMEGVAPVFASMVHSVTKAGVDTREMGVLAHEYETKAVAEARKLSIAERIAARREGKSKDYSTGASGLAGDYENLTEEVLAAFSKAVLQGAA